MHRVAYTCQQMFVHYDLQQYIEHSEMPESVQKFIACQILTACSDLHSKGFAHGDIKPGKLVFDDLMRARLVGLGFLHKFAQATLSPRFFGSAGFMAPEIVEQRPGTIRGDKADIFSAGVVFFLLHYRQQPFGHAQDG